MSTCYNRIFHVFQIYVAYISSGCCKSRSSIVYVAMVIHVCCKCVFQMFQLFQTYVASVLFGYCICCSGYRCMLQVCVPNVSSVLDLCCYLQVFYLDVAYVSDIYCKCVFKMFHLFQTYVASVFTWMLQLMYTYAANAVCKCFTYFRRML
jgi:hypothetical protein